MSEKKITVPNIGDFEKVEVIEVLVKEGQTIKKDESIITLESDKSSVEVPSNYEGKIKKINIKVGDKVSEGSLILLIETDENTQAEDVPPTSSVEKEKNSDVINFPKNKDIKNLTPKSLSTSTSSTETVKLASPNVRKFIRELGAKIADVSGSERAGRITKEDVKVHIKNELNNNIASPIQNKKNIKNEYEHHEFGKIEIKDIPRVKKLSGPHLVRSWTEIPHVTHHDEIDITEMEEFRSSLRDLYTGQKISVTPLAFIIRAMVNALKAYPNFNTSLDSDSGKVVYKKYFHIGVAVDTPHGLMVPKIRNVDNLGVKEIGLQLRTVSKLCKELKIDKKEFFGGSMTISSLGGIGGVTFFTPIINPPEVSILGVGKSYEKVMKINDQFISRKILPISLSYDHRIIDGAEAARFVVHLSQSLGKDFAFKLAV